VPDFRRVVVETTGIADPAPIVYTIAAEPVVRHRFVLDGVVAAVDARNGLAHPESVKQAAVADVIVLTKVDVAAPNGLEQTLRRLNPAAEIVEAAFGDVEPARVIGRHRDLRAVEPGEPVHDDEIRSFCLVLEEQLDWTAFGIWLTMLLQARGADLLRVKGLLDVGAAGPLLLNGVQHVVSPPEHLDVWPDDDRSSRIVFIGRDIDREEVEASLLAFNRAAAGKVVA
jgi:G3E family GTPase